MSIRNNEERMGVKDEGTNPPPVANMAAEASDASVPNVPMSFSTPTEFVELPSGGRFYPEGHPLHGVETIEIRFMTAKEEDILTSKALLKKGIAVDRMLQSVIIDKNINLNDFLVGDKNALVLAARCSGYGNEYKTRTACPACATQQEYSFDLEECELQPGGAPEGSEDIEETENGTFLTTAPRTKAKVEIRLVNGHDEKNLLRTRKTKEKHKMPQTFLTDQFRTYIVSVNDINDPSYIGSYIDNMPAMDSKHIRSVYKQVAPNVDMVQEFGCDTCGFEGDMEVPLSADFFWPK
jgi:glutaredoxin